VGRNAIELDHLSKRYLLGESHFGGTLGEAVTHSIRRLGRPGERRRRDEIWSLRDVSLEVPEGGALGVIGRNGAGKSTLLKILGRITEPTTGVARTRGRVAALLEVGTGFHPELTGRENVYLNAAILGMSRRDTERRFDEIVSFAAVQRFIDTPIKRYSSGMHLRLAFAVAAHLEPDIMVVDEVLAVGDAEFQAKCLGRMSTVEREGRTVVFVSHNLDAILRLCPQTMWLDQGTIQAIGPTADVVDTYVATQVDRLTRQQVGEVVGDRLTLRAVLVTDESGKPVEAIRRDRPFTIEVRFSLHTAIPGLDFAAYLVNMRGVEVLSESWADSAPVRSGEAGDYVARLTIPPVLNVGEYLIGLWMGTAYETLLEEMTAGRIRLEGDTKGRPDRVVDLGLPWLVRRVAEHDKQSFVDREIG
jgi:ABC-type polysaccharide/polyol phosphate transport system ATPase subunit